MTSWAAGHNHAGESDANRLQKRKRREYRLLRKEQFKRPEPGFSLYEGRTRGKRMKYTYSDDEDFLSDSTFPRRSTRNTGTHTPAEPSGPVITASGRQIRAPSRLNAETQSNGGFSTAASTQGDAGYDEAGQDIEMDDAPSHPPGRPRRSAAVNHGMNGWASKKKHRSQEYDSEDDEDSEPDLGDDEEDEHVPYDEEDDEEEEFDEDDEMLDDDQDLSDSKVSLVIKIPIKVVFDSKSGKYIRLSTIIVGQKMDEVPTDRSASFERGSGDSVSESTKGGDDTTPASPVQTAEEISVIIKQVTPEPDLATIPSPSLEKPKRAPSAPPAPSSALPTPPCSR